MCKVLTLAKSEVLSQKFYVRSINVRTSNFEVRSGCNSSRVTVEWPHGPRTVAH